MPAPRSPSSSGVFPLEIGALSAASPLETQFFGSSSGVFFANTVLRAFADRVEASSPSDTVQNTESPDATTVNDCLAEQSDDLQVSIDLADNTFSNSSSSSYGVAQSYSEFQDALGRLPEKSIAKELVMTYFELWHPLFPFLHGPSFLLELEDLYANDSTTIRQTTSHIAETTCRVILFQSIFNLAAKDRPDIILPPCSRIKSTSTLMSLLGVLTLRNETPFIQAMLAVQIYLIASMSLNAASIIGGTLLRKTFQAGFHRCPYRYIQLSKHVCDMRKRIFWCIYATDRYLSQALGHPIGFQDSDVDVCMSGTRELHIPVPRATQTKEHSSPRQEVLLHLPDGHPDHPDLPHLSRRGRSASDERMPNSASVMESSQDRTQGCVDSLQGRGDEVLASYVRYGRIVGRALELFHKSIHSRSIGNGDILLLKTEVHSWWNHLPSDLQELQFTTQGQSIHTGGDLNAGEYSFAPFFTILYQQLILLINRPFLSSDPSTVEFKSSLQTCITASRKIISTLHGYLPQKHCISAPGILSGAWMSGLVIAFACELNAYPSSKGFLEIEACLTLLHGMGKRWNSARHCHSILGTLLSNLRNGDSRRELSSNQEISDNSRSQSTSRRRLQGTRAMVTSDNQESNKRKRTMTSETENSNDIWNIGNQQDYLAIPSQYIAFDGTEQSAYQSDEFHWPDAFAHVSLEALFRGEDLLTENMGPNTSLS